MAIVDGEFAWLPVHGSPVVFHAMRALSIDPASVDGVEHITVCGDDDTNAITIDDAGLSRCMHCAIGISRRGFQ